MSDVLADIPQPPKLGDPQPFGTPERTLEYERTRSAVELLNPKPTSEPLPQWVQHELKEARKEGVRFHKGFTQDDPFHAPPRRYSRVVAIAYPNQRHWTVEGLQGNADWVDTGKQYHSEELALAAARRMAYSYQTPYRVKEVVWNG